MKNIVYKSEKLAEFFAVNRIAYSQFYESERKVIEKIGLQRGKTVLDIGCGCGGLGLALRDEFDLDNYTGIEINTKASKVARQLNSKALILNSDLLDVASLGLDGVQFDAVFSLSGIDWNVRFSDMFDAAWSFVAPGGFLVSTFRLTTEGGCLDPMVSFQHINFEEECEEKEVACYVVLNAADLFKKIKIFNPSKVISYGYWGPPSKTAKTPYRQLCFSAFALKKRLKNEKGSTTADLLLPQDILRQFSD